jgi:hypothetical protein
MMILGGLPRSGITLLASLLNKDANIYVTTTSPFVEVLYRNYSLWNDPDYQPDFDTDNMRHAKIPFLQGMTKEYYKQLTTKRFVIDKRRQWQNVANIEMYRAVYGELPKIICPIRSVPEIITSYKTLYAKNKREWNYEELKDNKFETSYFDLADGYKKYPDCFLFVEYDDLVDDTLNTLGRVYKFMNLTMPQQELGDIESSENEGFHSFHGLHTLRSTISRDNVQPKDVLTATELSRFSNMKFWETGHVFQ